MPNAGVVPSVIKIFKFTNKIRFSLINVKDVSFGPPMKKLVNKTLYIYSDL